MDLRQPYRRCNSIVFAHRYNLLPSLIAAGQRATLTGFPLAARCDLYWPEFGDKSASDHQYVFLEDILVAPILNSTTNLTSRNVWLPPGRWQDVWSGYVASGPIDMVATQPFERQPMWFRRDGGLLVTCSDNATRADEQDWSTLTLEAFPSDSAMTTKRKVFERNSTSSTDLELSTDGHGSISVRIMSSTAHARGWAIRFHLAHSWRVAQASIDGEVVREIALLQLAPGAGAAGFNPLGGVGTAPAPSGGPVVELHLAPGGAERKVVLTTKSA